MKVNPEQLPDQLAKRLDAGYLVTGDEPLLVQEACDRIRERAVAEGYEERTVFIAEVQQAGLFRMQGIPEEQMERLMGVNCPTILFPYAREAIANLVARGGFQQLLLDPVNFQALFEQSREESEEGQQH